MAGQGSRPIRDRVSVLLERFDPLDHPFFERWLAGSLSYQELALYSGQGHHAVAALARASVRLARRAPLPLRRGLEAHARVRITDLRLWEDFAYSVGGVPDAPRLPETGALVNVWEGDRRTPFAPALVSLYVASVVQRHVSAATCESLVAHYGVEAGTASAYFDAQAARSHDIPPSALDLIDADSGCEDAVINAACISALRAYSWMSDGIDRSAVAASAGHGLR
jgi:pyrroloquinoline quinone (PQQ) biosynthesis protein C